MVSNTSEMELKMKLMENYVSSELKEDDDSKKKFKKSSGVDLQSPLASAEEFSDLMDQNDGGRELEGSSEAVSTVKDKASRKQLKWERDKADKKKNWSKGKKTFAGGGKKRFKKR